MSRFRSLSRLALLVLTMSACVLARPAAAGTLTFTYYYTGDGVASAGFLTTTDTLVGGRYTVLGIDGLRNTNPISALIAAGGFAFNDNLMSPSATYFTPGGVSYTAGGTNYNLYTNSFGFAPCNDGANWETATGNCGGQVPVTLSVQAFTPDPNELYFAYTYTGNGVSSAGIMATTNFQIGGNYTVVGMNGLRNGTTISSLIGPGGFAFNDNLLNPLATYLSPGGLSYVAGGINYNIYTNSFGFSPCNDHLNWETATGNCGGQRPIDLTIQQMRAVPEPGTVVLLATGVVTLGLRRLRQKRAAA